MPGRSRTPTPRVRATLARQAEAVAQAAGLLGGGIEFSPQAREALVGLLGHLASEGARETIDTISWDRVMRLSRTIVEPHRPPARYLRATPTRRHRGTDRHEERLVGDEQVTCFLKDNSLPRRMTMRG